MISNEHKDFPPLNGLVLAGGKSVRMGQAKDALNWHGKEQKYHSADLLKPFCDEVFISCRQDQLTDFDADYNALTDTFLNMGPFGGILSARKVLINHDVLILKPQNPDALMNVNTPEDAKKAQELLNSKGKDE